MFECFLLYSNFFLLKDKNKTNHCKYSQKPNKDFSNSSSSYCYFCIAAAVKGLVAATAYGLEAGWKELLDVAVGVGWKEE
jgi:hypothetical protein